MIAGVGIDLVDIAAFASLLDEPGSAFAERSFTAAERALSRLRPSHRPAQHLAARYAAKEACIKALSQALAPSPLPAESARLIEYEVIADPDGRPRLSLTGDAHALLLRAGVTQIHLSITHEANVAAAVVILERGDIGHAAPRPTP